MSLHNLALLEGINNAHELSVLKLNHRSIVHFNLILKRENIRN